MRCFFVGSRDAEMHLLEKLERSVEQHRVEFGVRQFVVGHYGNFDRMAISSVLKLKKKYSDVELFILLPYHPSERAADVPKGCDGTIYPDGLETVPRYAAIVYANQYMVRNSDYLIAYAGSPVGNTVRLLDYAKRCTKIVITELGKAEEP